MNPIESGRIRRHYTQRIEAPPETVFPLICPVREGEWLDGWAEELEMVHTRSGVAEDGCVFVTRHSGRPETVWMITRHDADQRVVEFVRVTTGLVATRLTVALQPGADRSSAVQITYEHTPLGPEGRAFLRDNYSEEAFRKDMAWWEDSMNHWLRHGEVLRKPATH